MTKSEHSQTVRVTLLSVAAGPILVSPVEETPTDPDATDDSSHPNLWLWLSPVTHHQRLTFGRPAESPENTKDVEVHPWLSLAPVFHPPVTTSAPTLQQYDHGGDDQRANGSLGLSSKHAEGRKAASEASGSSCQTIIDWNPGVIRKRDFETSSIRFVDAGDETRACPALLVDWDLFRILEAISQSWRSWGLREMERDQWQEENGGHLTMHELQLRTKAAEEERMLNEVRNDANNNALREALWQIRRGRQSIEERLEDLRSRKAELNQNVEREEKRCEAWLHQLPPILNGAMIRLGVIPRDDSNGKPAVQIIETVQPPYNGGASVPPLSEQNQHAVRYAPVAPPEPEQQPPINPTEEPVGRRFELAYAHLQRVNAEFEAHRDQYPGELSKFLNDNRGKDDELTLEQRFGQLWFQRTTDITRKLVEAEQSYEKVEEEWRAALPLNDDYAFGCPTFIDKSLGTSRNNPDPKQLGTGLSERKRKWIEMWRSEDEEAILERRRKRMRDLRGCDEIPTESEENKPLSFGSDEHEGPRAVGQFRRKIDAFNEQCGRSR
ncbi:hypothetical protein BU26DRAFT_510714 [Trematosphaeria pertusa]|uniref:Uncharacterized protein n=1 Tax=Trematosphaeria pertusa TaxID=390896 RepID=A0A6A6HVT6_9PLEO|nr:uncharacterized protein BU26DRAFT_510714 [Trematosphaeria pertusa]KAF2242304.1 hypothetical protein BU26DRAFT_510714 [Trematosphaeria pertusa]